MHLIHTHKAPSYLEDTVTATASVSSRGRLRSASSSRYEQPRARLKFGRRCFSPAAWNTLPLSLQQLTNTDSFKRQLKTVIFERAFLKFRLLTSFYTLIYRVNFVSFLFFHVGLRALRQVRASLPEEVAKTVACSIIQSRLDYCNALFTGMSESNLLQEASTCPKYSIKSRAEEGEV